MLLRYSLYRGPVRIGEILQLVEPSLSHVRFTLIHPATSHPLKQQHLRHRAALFSPLWTRVQRSVRTSRLSLPLGDTEGPAHLTLCMELGSSARTQAAVSQTQDMLRPQGHSTIYASKYLNLLTWKHTHRSATVHIGRNSLPSIIPLESLKGNGAQ